MRKLIAICLIILFCGACSSLETKQVQANDRHVRQLQLYLLQGKMQAATAMLFFLQKANKPIPPKVLSQFYLQSCNPYSAFKAVSQIQNPSEKKLYQAILLSMISTDQKLVSKRIDDERASYPLPLHQKEVWRDEWQDVNYDVDLCDNPPVLTIKSLKRKYKAKAKELFAQLPLGYYFHDFAIVSMALAVGHTPNNREELIAFYAKQEQSNPFYQQLVHQQVFSDPKKTAATPLVVDDNRIQLTGIVLHKQEDKKLALRIPQLLDMSSNEPTAKEPTQ